MKDHQAAMAKFRRSNEALRADLPGIAKTFDDLLELLAVTQPRLPDGERERVIKVGLAVGSIALAFPPFYFQGAGGARLGLGHSFILSPPKISPDNPNSSTVGVIDGLGLIAILIGIALLTWAATTVRWSKR